MQLIQTSMVMSRVKDKTYCESFIQSCGAFRESFLKKSDVESYFNEIFMPQTEAKNDEME